MIAEQQLIEELGNLDLEQTDIATAVAQVSTSDPDVVALKANVAAVHVSLALRQYYCGIFGNVFYSFQTLTDRLEKQDKVLDTISEQLQLTPSPVAQERLNRAVEAQKDLRDSATKLMYVYSFVVFELTEVAT